MRERGDVWGVANGWQGKVGEKMWRRLESRRRRRLAGAGKDALVLRTGNDHQ